jgi:RNA polymerase sigma-70 factor (ECF subfamily)
MDSPSRADECRAFLEAQGREAPASSEAPAAGELAAALGEAIDRGVAAWPALRPDRIGFARFLGDRVPPDVALEDGLRGRALGELYLAFACLAGDPRASAELDERYLKELVELLARQRIPHDVASETVQRLRIRLLTGERPVLRAYSGAGSLRGWLRITALREAIRAQRRARGRDDDEVSEALADAAGDPGLQYQRRLYQDEFRAAFGQAVASLSVRERNLLKQSVLYGATVDDLGALYQVHRATAARWIAAARERLAEATRLRMIEQLKIEPSEYDSILQLIRSQLDVSVIRVLG